MVIAVPAVFHLPSEQRICAADTADDKHKLWIEIFRELIHDVLCSEIHRDVHIGLGVHSRVFVDNLVGLAAAESPGLVGGSLANRIAAG